MYFYILSSDVKSPWNYNLAFFDILLTTLSNACVLNVRSFVFFDLSFDCLSIFFFSSDNPCVQSSSFDKPCFIRWQVLVFICSFYFSMLLPSHSRMQLYLLSDKKCILISTATALLFTVVGFCHLTSQMNGITVEKLYKSRPSFRIRLETSVTLLSNKPEPSFSCIN